MPAKSEFDAYHLRSGQIADLLGISTRSFYEQEGTLFQPLPRDHTGRRHMALAEACTLYHAWWHRLPMEIEMLDFFVRQGVDKAEAQTWVRLLESKKLLR